MLKRNLFLFNEKLMVNQEAVIKKAPVKIPELI